jgi:3-dehydroquinate dehydratase-1
MTKPITIKKLTLGQGIPKICVPLTGTDAVSLKEEASAARAAGADLVEWRADFYQELEQEQKLSETLKLLRAVLEDTPLLFTIRTKAEGGSLEISTEDYSRTVLFAAESKQADLVDIEVFDHEQEKKELIRQVQKTGVCVIASSHDFQKTDDQETLLKRFQKMDETGADILKMAVMPQNFGNVADLLKVTSQMAAEYTDKPLISMSMGSLGAISRISGEATGSCVTFGTVGAASAPGQFPIRDLKMHLESLHRQCTNA